MRPFGGVAVAYVRRSNSRRRYSINQARNSAITSGTGVHVLKEDARERGTIRTMSSVQLYNTGHTWHFYC